MRTRPVTFRDVRTWTRACSGSSAVRLQVTCARSDAAKQSPPKGQLAEAHRQRGPDPAARRRRDPVRWSRQHRRLATPRKEKTRLEAGVLGDAQKPKTEAVTRRRPQVISAM